MAHREQRSNREKKKPKQDKDKKAAQPSASLFTAQTQKAKQSPPPSQDKK